MTLTTEEIDALKDEKLDREVAECFEPQPVLSKVHVTHSENGWWSWVACQKYWEPRYNFRTNAGAIEAIRVEMEKRGFWLDCSFDNLRRVWIVVFRNPIHEETISSMEHLFPCRFGEAIAKAALHAMRKERI